MKILQLTLLFLLASCQTWGWSETADALMPDEFTLGQGSSEFGSTSGHIGYEPAYADEGESESTYAALTWDIPSLKTDDGMDRRTQRNLSLLIDHMAAERDLSSLSLDTEIPKPTKEEPFFKLAEGVKQPPKSVLYFGLGLLICLILFVIIKIRTSDPWR